MSTDYEYTINKYSLLEQLDTIFFKLRTLNKEDLEAEDLTDDLYMELSNLLVLIGLLLKQDDKIYIDKSKIKTVRISTLKKKLYDTLYIISNVKHLTLQPDIDLSVDDIATIRQLRNYLNIV